MCYSRNYFKIIVELPTLLVLLFITAIYLTDYQNNDSLKITRSFLLRVCKKLT